MTRHNGLLPAPTYYTLVVDLFMLRACDREVANLLQTCYGETVLVDFGLFWIIVSLMSFTVRVLLTPTKKLCVKL